MEASSAPQRLVSIYTPRGRDATIVAGLLKEIGTEARAFPSLVEFEKSLSDDTAFAVVTDDALASADLRNVAAWIKSQPAWSDLPIVVLTQQGGGPERNPTAARLSEILRNVTFLERPFHPTTFVSMARTALRGRERQFESRKMFSDINESEQRLRTALSAGHLGSWQLDLQNFLLSTTATCRALFGYGADENFGYEDLQARIHADDAQRVRDTVTHSIDSGEDYFVEYRVVWRDGTERWASIRARQVRDTSTNARYMVGVSSDITERKEAEAVLRRSNEALEARVAERTAELETTHALVLDEMQQRERAEALLRQSQKMEMIGQLTGGVAHDFNNLLMAVIGNLDMLERRAPDDPKFKRLIDGAMQGARRGATLTQRLLAFARRQDLKVEARTIGDLVGGMTDLIERSIGSQVELKLELDKDLPATMVDSNQIELALLNLVVNARDAMPRGGSLTVAARHENIKATTDLKAGDYVVLSVTDTGQGMSEDTLKKATEPFFSTKEVGKGTGLGLSMIDGVARQLDGALRLSSKVGIGTCAELWLPAAPGDVPVNAAPTAIEVPQHTHPSRILFVDDDGLIAMSTVDMLEDLGHQVVEVNSPFEALKLVENGETFDLLITDYSMPKMTGAELALAVKDVRPNLPVLLATGYADLPSASGIDLRGFPNLISRRSSRPKSRS